MILYHITYFFKGDPRNYEMTVEALDADDSKEKAFKIINKKHNCDVDMRRRLKINYKRVKDDN